MICMNSFGSEALLVSNVYIETWSLLISMSLHVYEADVVLQYN